MNSLSLHDLNPMQQKAVQQLDGPLLVLAGAGSGKTRVLVYRIALLLIEKQINIHNILSVTFTNKAAQEMRDRVFYLLRDYHINIGYNPWIGTFHSTCAHILRDHFSLITNRKTFTIYDQQDQLRLVKKNH